MIVCKQLLRQLTFKPKHLSLKSSRTTTTTTSLQQEVQSRLFQTRQQIHLFQTHSKEKYSHKLQERSIFSQQRTFFSSQQKMSSASASTSTSADALEEKTSERKANRLLKEKSPYLLQHAYNPVDWYPWGPEAFEKAKKENKPIFLSVGYSTCHWCHVMERESFENEDIASLMNEHFVNIKVDREERPDVDRVYMSFVQAITGGGGWPMSVFLTPTLHPFFGGTYFPPNSRLFSGTPSFPELLSRVSNLWKEKSDKLEEQGKTILMALKGEEESQEDVTGIQSNLTNLNKSGSQYLNQGVKRFLQTFDVQYGGFGNAPKFPRPSIFNFLFRMHKFGEKDQSENILQSCLFTLEKMAQGGMYDQLGGGFHRYSVDSTWHVPHFEKMLYDQAQLVQSYLDAYQITGDSFFSNIATETLEYVMRDMTYNDKQVGDCISFSAEDADSYPDAKSKEKKEGAFYVFSHSEVENLLKDEKTFNLFTYMYDVRPKGNVPSGLDPHGEMTNMNILIQRHDLKEAVTRIGDTSEEELKKLLQDAKSTLLKYRNQRPRPHLDDKIITSWNGIMLGAFARASTLLKDIRYLDYAKNCAQFIKRKLYDPKQNILFRTARDGETNKSIRGYLSDYAFLISGLLDLYEACGELVFLQWADQLQEKQIQLFMDTSLGGSFFDTDGLDESILMRPKESYDGAEPSGNSVSAMNLLKLGKLLNKDQYIEIAQKTVATFQKQVEEIPQGVPQLACALIHLMQPTRQIVIAYKSSEKDQNLQQLVETIGSVYQPNKLMIFLDLDSDNVRTFWTQKFDYLSSISQLKEGKPTVYLCYDNSCQSPTNDHKKIKELVSK